MQTAKRTFLLFTNRLVCHDLHIIASCLSRAGHVVLAVLARFVNEAFAVFAGQKGDPSLKALLWRGVVYMLLISMTTEFELFMTSWTVMALCTRLAITPLLHYP